MRPARVTRISWRQAAACRTMDPDLFFPLSASGPGAQQASQAKTVCFRCPVRLQCLQHALANDEAYGIWGGLTEDERRPVMKRRRNQPAQVQLAAGDSST
jgi:WhiB family transcriptional regulator, redox-sensing transcriptional regulator